MTHVVVAGVVFGAMLLGAGVLHLLPRLGAAGRGLSERLIRAPGLDVVVTYFTVAPPVVCVVVDGWWGVAGALVGQVAAVLVWCQVHELCHPAARRGPRIVKELNEVVGAVRNHAALWVTVIAAPGFWLVRVVEIVLWPCFIVLVHFPRYKEGEWVNCSRQKFEGLVGHDLIWCLYCDWMTGVWSLGTEMLRNVESFWCPIRFPAAKKSEHCEREFPDLAQGWVDAEKGMAEVAETLREKYEPRKGPHVWYGHPRRLKMEGEQEPAEE